MKEVGDVWNGFEVEAEAKGLDCDGWVGAVEVGFGGAEDVLKEDLKPNWRGLAPSAAGGDLLVAKGEVMLLETGDGELDGFWLAADPGFKNGFVDFDYGFRA